MSTGTSAPTSSKTLAKLGSHLRWQIEKAGVDPESVDVVILVGTDKEGEQLRASLQSEFDDGVMKRSKSAPHVIVVHGVCLQIGVREGKR